MTGIRYVTEGGVEKEQEEIGAPEGTTVLVKNLFYNTPPRRKFLKQPQTEGSYVADLMEHLALSNPQVSFKYIMNGQTRFYTTGNGELQEIIYRIYGRDIAAQLIPFAWQGEGIVVSGFLGKPVINRANRNYEIFYINGRYIKSNLISRSIEEGYREYLMQHKFPFCVLHFRIDTRRIDVNVHPTKMEVRIADGQTFYETVKQAIHEALHDREMIPEISLMQTKEKAGKQTVKESIPEPFEKNRIAGIPRPSGSAAINRIYQENRPRRRWPIRQTTAIFCLPDRVCRLYMHLRNTRPPQGEYRQRKARQLSFLRMWYAIRRLRLTQCRGTSLYRWNCLMTEYCLSRQGRSLN